MQRTSVVIALILSVFGGYLCFKEEYEAGAAMVGAGVAALALNQDDSDERVAIDRYKFLEETKESLLTENKFLRESNERLNDKNIDLEIQVALLKQELQYKEELAERDRRLIYMEAKLQKTEEIFKTLPESKLEELKQPLSETEEKDIIESLNDDNETIV